MPGQVFYLDTKVLVCDWIWDWFLQSCFFSSLAFWPMWRVPLASPLSWHLQLIYATLAIVCVCVCVCVTPQVCGDHRATSNIPQALHVFFIFWKVSLVWSSLSGPDWRPSSPRDLPLFDYPVLTLQVHAIMFGCFSWTQGMLVWQALHQPRCFSSPHCMSLYYFYPLIADRLWNSRFYFFLPFNSLDHHKVLPGPSLLWWHEAIYQW